jgi:hypothetical protein
MPRVVIETSIYEPIEVEAAGKVFRSVPMSARLIKAIRALDKKSVAGEIDQLDASVEQAALMFGAPAEEFAEIDIRILRKMIGQVTSRINPDKSAETPEETAEKNAQRPGDVTPA